MEIQKFAMQSDSKGRLVQLDCELNDDLLFEGYANELCASVMAWRKSKNCGLTDKLNMLLITNNKTLVKVIEIYKDMISERLICDVIEMENAGNRVSVLRNGAANVYLTAIVNINDKGKLTFQNLY